MILLKKMLRDIRQNVQQFVVIFLLATAGVVVFSGINSVTLGFKNNSAAFLQECNHPDYWFETLNVPDAAINSIKALDGVTQAERRRVKIVYENDIEIRLIAPEDNIIARPYLMQGENYDKDGEGIWLSDTFAKLNNYATGDIFTINGTHLTVRGRVLSSEFVYISASVKAQSGYAYVSPQTLAKLAGSVRYTSIVLTVEKNTNKEELEKNVQNILAANYQRHTAADNQASTLQINDKVSIFNKFSYIFPVLFFLLATVTMLTTMTRLIENQRVQVGTLMALGYGKNKIKTHYLSYGVWIGILGGIFGLFMGRLIIPAILIPLLKAYFNIPYWDLPISGPGIVSIILMAICCVAAVFIALGKRFKRSPADILKGTKTKKSRRSILEKIKPLWDKLSFEAKSSLRNISRNKVRASMAIIGVLSCMMLILAGFGMRNSLNYTIDVMHYDIFQYENKIQIVPSRQIEIDQESQYLFESNVTLLTERVSREIRITVIDEGKFVKFHDDYSINRDGLIISESFAKKMKFKVNDEVEIKIAAKELTFKIAEILPIPVAATVYAARSLWENAGMTYQPTAILTGGLENSEELKQNQFVLKIINREEEVSGVKNAARTVDAVMYILLVGAIFLGVTVLINLGILNFSEMTVQYATLKVVGFYTKELKRMAFMENIIMTVIGWLIGIPCGICFLNIYMKILSSDLTVFFSHINPASFVIASIITLGCSIGVNVLLARKIKKIDMVKTLKSIE